MFRRIWQSVMIALARSSSITHFMQTNRATTGLATRYVAGKDPLSGVQQAQKLLQEKGIRSSLFYLGEYVDRMELVEDNLKYILKTIKVLTRFELDMHISVDPTQIGYSVNKAMCIDNAERIALKLNQVVGKRPGVNCIMLDMEDHSVVDDTLNLYHRLQHLGLPVAQTLQAYLRRTETDLQKIIQSGGRVRLVKGAFVGSRDIAFTRHAEIKANYRKLVELMFSAEAKANGFYPIVATHDDDIQEFAINQARKNGWKQGDYEFEMLLGVRTDVAENLASRGERIRLYVPFGKDWWPYAIRRIGENPSNAVLLARSLVS
jgi:proline dehydrogenase